jgi:hypothetical protein
LDPPGKGRSRGRDADSPTLGLPEANQFGFVLLLCGNPEDTGVPDLLGAQLLEECIGVVGRRNNLTALESHPLPLKSSEDLG